MRAVQADEPAGPGTRDPRRPGVLRHCGRSAQRPGRLRRAKDSLGRKAPTQRRGPRGSVVHLPASTGGRSGGRRGTKPAMENADAGCPSPTHWAVSTGLQSTSAEPRPFPPTRPSRCGASGREPRMAITPPRSRPTSARAAGIAFAVIAMSLRLVARPAVAHPPRHHRADQRDQPGAPGQQSSRALDEADRDPLTCRPDDRFRLQMWLEINQLCTRKLSAAGGQHRGQQGAQPPGHQRRRDRGPRAARPPCWSGWPAVVSTRSS